jgi:4-amino-4-deoxy-L-arabinose transferase-like glycosyltransferase
MVGRGRHHRATWAAALLLWAMFALALTSLRDEAPTFDEQGFLVRGLAYLRGEANGGSRAIRVGHPLGLNALNAALLVNDPAVGLPSDVLATGDTDFHRPASLFLWEMGNDVGRTMFLARAPTLWLGLLLAAVAGRWAGQMAADWGAGRTAAGAAGLLALALVALDPNILAHMRLVTTDLGLAAGAALGGYTLWRFLRRPALALAIVAGVGLGLLQNTKFTALLFLPLLGLVIVLALWQRRRALDRRFLLLVFVVYPLAGVLTLWAANGGQMGALREPLPLLGTLGGAMVPLSHHLDQLLDIGGRLQVGTPAFLLGRYSDSGWWWYFPVAFIFKTPLPTLLLLVYALLRIVRMTLFKTKPEPSASEAAGSAGLTSYAESASSEADSPLAPRRWPPATGHWPPAALFDLAALLIPAAGYFAIALTTDINLGYRHLLPVLPFVYVLIGVVVARAAGGAGWGARHGRRTAPAARVVPLLLLFWLSVATVWIHPHFLSFFNLIAGGADNGWRVLVDSNIDWGQDLARLKTWLDDNEVERVWLSYFGEGRPEYYGIAYDGLDSFPPRLMNPAARPFFPYDPAPGWYAISATTLQGVHFADPDQFRYFRERPPDGKVGYSIFLYNVPPRGAPVDLLLSNTQVDDLAPADFARLGTNDVTLRWFDGTQAVVVPGRGGPVWLALAGGEELHPGLRPFVVYGNAAEAAGDGYRLYRAEALPLPDARPMQLGGHAVGYGGGAVEVGQRSVDTLTVWRNDGPPRPVKVYIHVRDEAGRIVAQWDGLGAAWEGWREGDALVQAASVPLPDDLPTGVYHVVAGLYDPTTNQRWRFADGQDGVELAQFARE